MSIIMYFNLSIPPSRNQQLVFAIIQKQRDFLLMGRVVVNDQPWKQINRSDFTCNCADKASSLPVIQLDNRDVWIGHISVDFSIDSLLYRPHFNWSFWTDIDLQIFTAILYCIQVDIICKFGIVVDHILEKFDLFGPHHCQVSLILVHEAYRSIRGKVLIDDDILDQLIVLTTPDLHYRLCIHGNYYLVFFWTLHIHQWSLMTL